MKHIGFACLLGFALTLFNSVVLSAQETVQWGEAIDGLRMSLSVDYGAHELIFSIQSDRGSVVHLGENGIPVDVTVTLTTQDGKIRNGELGMSSAMQAMGTGIHDNIIEILPKSTYVIRHAMDDLVLLPKPPDVFPLTTLKSGDSVTGHLRGKYQKCPTSDCRMHEICWVGYLVSNTIQVR
jgi:hypothetical protein